jgi:hypothetical protein
MKRLKERLKTFVPWGAKGMHRLGILVLGLAMLLGVTQAGTLQRMLMGDAENAPSKQLTAAPVAKATKNPDLNLAVADKTSQLGADAASNAPNIVELVAESEYIIRGLVKDVTDGIENGLPYTEVTLQVSEAFRGQVGEEYTFRQFGLTAPRSMGNGKVNLNVTPDGWSKYKEGEDTVLFLYKPASITGLRTTVGLGQGKLAVNSGNVISQFENEGLFSKVEVNNNLLNDRDKRLLSTKKGPVNAESFISFVRRAVKGRWIEGGKMRHAK